MKRLSLLIVLLWLCASVQAQTISDKVKDMQKFPGFFTFYWDAKAGRVWLEIDKWNTEFLYVESLPAGIGSNDIGLDRGQLGDSSSSRSVAVDHARCLVGGSEGTTPDFNHQLPLHARLCF